MKALQIPKEIIVINFSGFLCVCVLLFICLFLFKFYFMILENDNFKKLFEWLQFALFHSLIYFFLSQKISIEE